MGSDRATFFSHPVTLRACPSSTESQSLRTLKEVVFPSQGSRTDT